MPRRSRAMPVNRAAHPHVTVDYQHEQNVHGGMRPDHVFYCGMDKVADSDIVLIQYEEFACQPLAEDVLRAVLSLPKKPLLLFVQHTMRSEFARWGAPLFHSVAGEGDPYVVVFVTLYSPPVGCVYPHLHPSGPAFSKLQAICIIMSQ